MTDETNLSDAPKKELEAIAAELDIPRRSRMSADELRDAIVAARDNSIPPGTPDQTGRPELQSVAEERAANRNPRRIGASN